MAYNTELSEFFETAPLLETTTPPESSPPAKATVPEETTAPFDFSQPHLTVYIARQSTEIYVYSIAPAGTEDWIPLANTRQFCRESNDPDGVHGWYSYIKYAAPYDGEECTLWRLKLEIVPEKIEEWLGIEDAEYSVQIFEDVELRDGLALKWLYDADKGEYFVLENMLFCGECPEDFQKTYQPQT